MIKAKSIPNFLSQEENDKILNLLKNIDEWERAGEAQSFWDNRSLSDKNIYYNHDKEIGKLIFEVRNRIGQKIKEVYKIDEVYPDLMSASRWWDGMKQEPHADDMTNAEGPGHEWFAHRHFGAIIYLNENYEGGHTFYPNYDFEIIPKSGTLAIHPGDPDHLHGVTEVKGATRYTLSSFWTKDIQYFDNWSL
jgi:hypothetical protein